MAYDEGLAQRVREAIGEDVQVAEKKMFGGIAFMVNGHMAVGVLDDHIMLRLGEEGATAALEEEHTREMDFTGRPMRTMVYVDAEGIEEDEDLEAWVGRGVAFARSLEPK